MHHKSISGKKRGRGTSEDIIQQDDRLMELSEPNRDLTPAEQRELSQLTRHIDNRESAKKYRLSQKTRISTLEDKVKKLQTEEEYLKRQTQMIQLENENLREQRDALRELVSEKLGDTAGDFNASTPTFSLASCQIFYHPPVTTEQSLNHPNSTLLPSDTQSRASQKSSFPF
jgi:bZIP transcription factor